MKIPFGKPMIDDSEKNAVASVLEGSILVHGPKAIEFEHEFANFTNAPYSISVSSCTAGMHLIYFALGIKSADEVIIPAQTHVATAHAVSLTGATPVFVDVLDSSGNIDYKLIKEKINPNTKAIAVVHYLGIPVDIKKVKQISDKYNLFLLEDCALAPGALVDGVHAGLHGDAGVFSFYPVKHLTTAEGGMIILKDKSLADKLKLIKAFGVNRSHGERSTPGLYDVEMLGFNYRMSEIHAAIGIEQLKKIKSFLEIRKENHELLSNMISNLPKVRVIEQPVNNSVVSSHYCLGLLLDKSISSRRAEIMDSLTRLGIGTSIYYPHPVPRLQYYKDKYGYDEAKYKNAAYISDNIIAFPVGPHLNRDDMNYIAHNTNKIWRSLCLM